MHYCNLHICLSASLVHAYLEFACLPSCLHPLLQFDCLITSFLIYCHHRNVFLLALLHSTCQLPSQERFPACFLAFNLFVSRFFEYMHCCSLPACFLVFFISLFLPSCSDAFLFPYFQALYNLLLLFSFTPRIDKIVLLSLLPCELFEILARYQLTFLFRTCLFCCNCLIISLLSS